MEAIPRSRPQFAAAGISGFLASPYIYVFEPSGIAPMLCARGLAALTVGALLLLAFFARPRRRAAECPGELGSRISRARSSRPVMPLEYCPPSGVCPDGSARDVGDGYCAAAPNRPAGMTVVQFCHHCGRERAMRKTGPAGMRWQIAKCSGCGNVVDCDCPRFAAPRAFRVPSR